MIQPNAKIEKNNGLRFFEQDVMFDDFVYDDYAELTLTVDYAMPGFGIILINSTSSIITEECEAFLFRIGYREASIEYKSGSIFQTILTIPTTIVPSVNNIVKIKFQKYKNEVYLTFNGETIFAPRLYKLPKSMTKFCLGVYSNAGNTIKEIYSNSKIPNYWSINMYNTVGGRIRFFDSGFEIDECKENAEIEQYKIALAAGTYYLKYDTSENNDILCYVFESDSSSIRDEEKNILDKNMSFTLDFDEEVNIKFVGTYGSVSNIILNTDSYAKYVATDDEDIHIEESSVIVNKQGLSKVNWTGTISSIYSPEESYIFCDGDYIVRFSDIIKMNTEYSYEYSMNDHLFVIRNKGELIYSCIAEENNVPEIILFHNIDALITDFSITKENGDTINYITSDTETRSISINRTAPIIITDESGEPLDISSSYRIFTTFKENGDIDYDLDRYVFTNIEREVFEPQIVLRTESYINNKLNSVRIFGIKEEIDYDYLYRVERNENDIGLCCSYNYVLIDGDQYNISNNTNEIHLYDVNLDDYKYIIVDYLKDDSYAINPNFENNTYEIDISTNKTVMYYFDVDNSLLSEYKIIPFDNFESRADSYYLCIRNDTLSSVEQREDTT